MASTEERLRDAAAQSVARYREALVGVGISFSPPVVEVWKADAGNRTSELRVCFYRDGNLEDVFEFHLFRDGKQVVTEPEINEWIDDQVSTLLATGQDENI